MMYSAYTVAFFFTSLILGKVQSKIGRGLALRIGVLTQIVSALAFIGLQWIDKP